MQSITIPKRYSYNCIGDNPGVYCKIDYLTMMFQDCSMMDILSWLNLDDCVCDFALNAYERVMGWQSKLVFSYQGVLLEADPLSALYVDNTIDLKMFDVPLTKIRLNISGTGLDYLRSIGVDFNEHYKTVPDLPENAQYRFKRIDWAYDFINYAPDFMDHLVNHCVNNVLPSGRLPVVSVPGGIGLKLVTGNQKTVYLGSPQSDRMLRIYDKKMEQSDLNTGTYIRDNPYNNPESWFRIEWQTRNQMCQDIVDSNVSFETILREIFDRYAFASEHRTAAGRPPVDFWYKLFNWDELQALIIQNAKSVQLETPAQRIINSVENTMIRSFMYYYTLRGPSGFLQACNDYLNNLYRFDPVSARRLTAFINKTNEIGNDIDLTDSTPGLYVDMGRFFFSLFGSDE